MRGSDLKLPVRFLFAAGLSAVGCHSMAQDRLIVRLQDAVNAYSVAASHHVQVLDRTLDGPFAYYLTPIGSVKATVVAQLRADSRVVWVEDDAALDSPENQSGGKGSTVAVVNDRNTLYGFNAGMLTKISFSTVRATTPGRPVRIAVLDTGLARRSFNLWSRVVASANYVEAGASAYDQPKGTDSNQNGTPDEGVGHGTFVTGLIDQVAPLCPLVVVRVADSDGRATAWRIVKGLAFAVAKGCEVANVSLGSDVGVPALTDTIEWAEARGLLVVAAAGNANLDRVYYPGRISKVTCVSGVDHLDRKASFANYEGKVDTSAPATGLKSAWIDGTSVIWSGTSFAAPLVAGGIADCLRRRPKAFVTDLQSVASKAGDGINAINPAYNQELGVRLNLLKLDTSIMRLRVRP